MRASSSPVAAPRQALIPAVAESYLMGVCKAQVSELARLLYELDVRDLQGRGSFWP